MPTHLVVSKWPWIQLSNSLIPIDHYVTINLDGMEDLINAVGGIKVNNKIDFTLMVSMYQ